MNLRRVVVTGFGATSPLGCNVKTIWSRLLKGESGVKKLTDEGYKLVPSKVGGLVPMGTGPNEFNREKYYSKSKEREITLATAFAIKAAEDALKMANWIPEKLSLEDQYRTGTDIGTCLYDCEYTTTVIGLLKEHGYSKLTPFFLPRVILNMPSGQVSMKYLLKGPNHSSTTACATGLHSIGDSFRWIREGDADVMVCGGTEAALYPISYAAFGKMKALSIKFNDQPEMASRPWDINRDGFIMGEGCGILILEELNHAKKRGAKIYAEVLGYGQACDAHHMTAPDPKGMGAFRAMRAAVEDAEVDMREITQVNCHATSTHLGDLAELQALGTLFKEHTKNITVAATKAATGHLVAAAGAFESILSILSVHEGIIPPNRNLFNLDPEVAAIKPSPKFAGRQPVEWKEKRRLVLKNAFGFGGPTASVIYGNYIDS